MKRAISFCMTAGFLLASCFPAAAQELGYWRAESKTAHSITGDVGISAAKLTINFYMFDIVRARDLEPAEVSSVFDTDSAGTIKGRLYGMNIPSTRKFMHKNTLCGSEDTKWMVTYAEGNTLQLAFFSGEKAPTFTPDAISNGTSLCGLYTYTR